MNWFTEQSLGAIIGETFTVFIAVSLYFKESIIRFTNALVDKWKESKSKVTQDPVAKQIEADSLINSMLNTIMDEFGADRVYLFQFHNGERFYSGSSIQKFSCTHEVVGEGITPKQHLLQKLLVSSVPYYMNDVVKDQATYRRVEDTESYSLKQLCEIHGIKSMIGIPILKNDKIIGVFGMEWVRDYAGEFCETMTPKIYEVFKNRIQEFNLYL